MTLTTENNSPIYNCQPEPGECWVRELTEDDYLFQLAANLKALEDQDDKEGGDQLWYNYGNQDCVGALHIVENHGEKMPEPNVPVTTDAGGK